MTYLSVVYTISTADISWISAGSLPEKFYLKKLKEKWVFIPKINLS